MSKYLTIKKLLYASALIVSFSDYTIASGGSIPFRELRYSHNDGDYIIVDESIINYFSSAYNSYIEEDKNDKWGKSEEFKKSLQSLAVICNSAVKGKAEEKLVYTLEELGLSENGEVINRSGKLTAEQLSAVMGELFKDIFITLANRGVGEFAGELEDYIPRYITTYWGGVLLFKKNMEGADTGTVAVFKYLERLNKNKNEEYRKIMDSVVKYFKILKLDRFEPFVNGNPDSNDNSKSGKEEKHKKENKKNDPKIVLNTGNIEITDLNSKDIEDISKYLETRKINLHELINDTLNRLNLPVSINQDLLDKKWKATTIDPKIPSPPPPPPLPNAPIVLFTPSGEEIKALDVAIRDESGSCNNLSTVISLGLKNVGVNFSKDGDNLQFLPFISKFATVANPEPVKQKQIDQIYSLSAPNTKPQEISWKSDYSKDPLLGARVYSYDTKEIKSYSKEDIKLEPKAVTINNPEKAEEIRNSIEQRDGKEKLDEALKSVLKNHVQSFEDYIKAKQKLFAENKEKLVGEKFGAETTYTTFVEICKIIDEMNSKISPLLSSLADAGAKSYKDMFVIDGKSYNCTDLKKWLGGIVTSMNDEFKSELFKQVVFEKLFVKDKKEKKEYIMSLFESLLNAYKKIIDQKWQKENNEESDNENKKLEDEIKKIQQKNDLQYLNELYSLYFGDGIDGLLQISDNKERIELIAKNMKTKLISVTKYQEELDKKEKRPKLNYEKKTGGKPGKGGGLGDKIKLLEGKLKK